MTNPLVGEPCVEGLNVSQFVPRPYSGQKWPSTQSSDRVLLVVSLRASSGVNFCTPFVTAQVCEPGSDKKWIICVKFPSLLYFFNQLFFGDKGISRHSLQGFTSAINIDCPHPRSNVSTDASSDPPAKRVPNGPRLAMERRACDGDL
jgi:hypothetical protein